MSDELSLDNLQEYCRTCLSRLAKSTQSQHNLEKSSDIQKLIICLTSLDVSSEMDTFPKSVCEICYNKLQTVNELRNLLLSSTHTLLNMLPIKSECAFRDDTNPGDKSEHQNNVGLPKDSEINDEDLLLPEIAPCKGNEVVEDPVEIKYEIEFGDVGFTESLVEVQNEIDSEYEEGNEPNFYEKNALAARDDAASSSEDKERRTSSQIQRICNTKSLKCPRCDREVYKQVYLNAHIRAIHEGYVVRPFLCADCKKSFTRYAQLHEHFQLKHEIKRKFQCDYDACDASFRFAETLKTHRKLEHFSNDADDLEELRQLHTNQLSKEFEIDHYCQYCKKKFCNNRSLSRHLKSHLDINDHVCEICGVAKMTRTELLTHMRTHKPTSEKFQCPKCPQLFSRYRAIPRHVRAVHEGERNFQCSFCPKRFATLTSQKLHERLHTGERPYKCQECTKTFAQSALLSSHMKTHYKHLRKHVCKHCSQRFITRGNLADHERLHETGKLNICDICNKSFVRRQDLIEHKLWHDEEKEGA